MIYGSDSPNFLPVEALRNWRVFETTDRKEHHLVGSTKYSPGRTSSAIKEFDPVAVKATTSSGRVYFLMGEPGHSLDDSYVWARWCAINKVSDSKEVTEDYWKKICQEKSTQ